MKTKTPSSPTVDEVNRRVGRSDSLSINSGSKQASKPAKEPKVVSTKTNVKIG